MHSADILLTSLSFFYLTFCFIFRNILLVTQRKFLFIRGYCNNFQSFQSVGHTPYSITVYLVILRLVDVRIHYTVLILCLLYM